MSLLRDIQVESARLKFVVGDANLTGDASYHAFLWSKSRGVQDLGVLNVGSISIAQGINSSGTVVGGSATLGNFSFHAFIWTPSGGMEDLNNLIPAGTGWTLSNATAINKSGQIVGTGMRSGDFTQHAFLLTPTSPLSQ